MARLMIERCLKPFRSGVNLDETQHSWIAIGMPGTGGPASRRVALCRDAAPGSYQFPAIGLTSTIQPVGVFRNAVTVVSH
jgi:hypothetical protein